MKTLAHVLTMMVVLALLLQCGGTKKLTPEEYQNLSPQDRIIYLNKQIEKSPNDIQLKRMLYQEYVNLGMEAQAEQVMQEILELDPNQPDLQFEYAVLEFNKGRYKNAYRAFLNTLQSPAGETYRSEIANYITGPYVVQQVTNDSSDEAFPYFSPDGKKIAYQVFRNGNWDIAEMDLSDRSVKVLLNSPADEELPCYSPDGRFLLYTSNEEDRRPIENRFKVREIFEMSFSDQYKINLTQSIADDWLPRFNHAGDKIVFVSERSDLRRVPYSQKQSDIFVMNANGDFQIPLTQSSSNEGGSCFNVSDDKIYFHSNRNGTYDIFVMNADGSKPLLVVDNPQGDDVNPFVSPDSAHLVFFSNRDGNYEIYMANLDGSDQKRLTFNPADDLNPVFSPDGMTIAFHTNRDGNYNIYLINLAAPAGALTSADLINRLNRLLSN